MQIICDKDVLMQNEFTASSLYITKMKEAGLRNTRVRQQLFQILLRASKPLSIQDLAKRTTNVHFVSVYRSVDAMRKASVIKLVPQGFKSLFELSDSFKPHHHHATCERCGQTTQVTDSELEKSMRQLTIRSGLIPTEHHFELYGICIKCQES